MATKKYSFFRPHKRVVYTGELVDAQGVITKPPSMTKQSFAAECDINNIIKQYRVTGMVTHISDQAQRGTYTDLPDPLDFQESLELVRSAEVSFASLPSKIRDRFANDPGRFLAFCSDPANLKEMGELGLLNTPPAPQPPAEQPPPVNPPPAQ